MPEGRAGEDPVGRVQDGDVMAGDRRIARADTALPDWYVSDGAYRPVPIAWFAGALIAQVLVQPAIFLVLLPLPALLTMAASLAATYVIGRWSWRRGIRTAHAGWRWATWLTLGFFASFTLLSAAVRL